MKITIYVSGTPAPKGSWRFGRNGQIYPDSKDTRPWTDSVRYAARVAVAEASADRPMLPSGPVRTSIVFRMPRPKSHYRTGKRAGELKPSAPWYCESKPDSDKLERAINDAMKGIVWRDDSQVAVTERVKRYIQGGEEPGVTITVEKMA